MNATISRYLLNIFSGLVVLVWMTGCAGTPDKNPLLKKAESSFANAEKDSMVVTKAPVALKEAEEELEKSRTLWEDGGEKELIEHHAYIAKQKVAIARETAQLNAAQDEVERAEAERQRVLLKARRVEAEQAEQRAEEAMKRVREEREKSEELNRRLKQLEARPTDRGMVLTLGDVLFEFDKATLKSGGVRVVERLAVFLEKYRDREISIEGYTDSVGSEEYNRELSLRRAASVRDALLQRGIARNRITIRGYGEQFPVAGNDTEAGRQQNRRVEIVISEEEITRR